MQNEYRLSLIRCELSLIELFAFIYRSLQRTAYGKKALNLVGIVKSLVLSPLDPTLESKGNLT